MATAPAVPLRADEDTPISTARPAAAKPIPPEKDAFARLKEAGRRQFRREVFVLNQTSEGRLTWRWGGVGGGAVKGEGGPAGEVVCWEAELKHPLHKDGTLVLRTNIRPAPIAAQPPPSASSSWRPSGLSVSLLKSALQKNVRCSRASEAMRVALELLLR